MLKVKGHDELSQQCSTDDLTPRKLNLQVETTKYLSTCLTSIGKNSKLLNQKRKNVVYSCSQVPKRTLPTMTSQSGAHSLISHLSTASTPQPTRLRQGIKKSRQFKPRPPLINQSIALVKEENFPTCLTKGYDIKTE